MMNWRKKIGIAAGLLALAACQELPAYLNKDTLLARAGGKELRQSNVQSVVPAGVTGDDSVAFLEVYVDRWVRKQLKIKEAEVLFSSSVEDIDRMVEEYRQALLIRKLEQHYVDNGVDTTFTDDEIAAYYNSHKGDFKLEHPVVKGRIVRFPENFRQARRLREAMASPSDADQRDFTAFCRKNGLMVNDFRDHWTDFSEFLSYLPTLKSQNYNSMLSSSSVQEMRDNNSHYYFRIVDVRRPGDPIPLERLRPTIRRILFNQRQGETIRRQEEDLYNRSLESGEVEIYGRQKPEDEAAENE
ncbi:hypothetical protein [uncultured Alistipes sp.]|jgi:hypothetical protein|uniref:hypothetical protein n=1 Tax=uncultured Alistipes sp. TaxID=538949 RepID=UPI00338EB025